jgi:hypothetical protein
VLSSVGEAEVLACHTHRSIVLVVLVPVVVVVLVVVLAVVLVVVLAVVLVVVLVVVLAVVLVVVLAVVLVVPAIRRSQVVESGAGQVAKRIEMRDAG